PTRRIRQLLRPLRRQYDYVFLDCPPSISLVSESVFEAADALLVPVIPTTLSLRTTDQLERFIAGEDWRRPPKVMGFFSMVDRRRKLHRDIVEELSAGREDMLSAQIPVSTDVERMGVHRSPLGVWAPRSRAGRAYEQLWEEVEKRMVG